MGGIELMHPLCESGRSGGNGPALIVQGGEDECSVSLDYGKEWEGAYSRKAKRKVKEKISTGATQVPENSLISSKLVSLVCRSEKSVCKNDFAATCCVVCA